MARPAARAYAATHELRVIGVDRPGIGRSTSHLYRDILDWTGDLVRLADALGVDTMRLVGSPAAGRTHWPPEQRCPSGSTRSVSCPA